MSTRRQWDEEDENRGNTGLVGSVSSVYKAERRLTAILPDAQATGNLVVSSVGTRQKGG